jgi:SRSO17 transposase
LGCSWPMRPPGGVALVDRDLYLPKSWTDDRARCRAAGVPDEVGFQTKPQLGQAMVERALAARVPFGWVTGDTVYGGDRRLRVWLEEHAIRHVMAAPLKQRPQRMDVEVDQRLGSHQVVGEPS